MPITTDVEHGAAGRVELAEMDWINEPNPWIVAVFSAFLGAILSPLVGKIFIARRERRQEGVTDKSSQRLCYSSLVRWYLELALFMALSFFSVALFFQGVLDADAAGRAARLVGIIVVQLLLWRAYAAWGIRLQDCIRAEEQR